MYEKKRREIEKIRKVKQLKFRGRLDQNEQKDLDHVPVRDINDNEQGVYNIGGSLGELVVGLIALDTQNKKEKNDNEITHDTVLNVLKSLVAQYKGKLCFPRVKRTRVIDEFRSENPLQNIYDALEKEEGGEEEAAELINKLTNIVCETDVFKLLSDIDLSDEETLKKYVNLILTALIKDVELRDSFAKLDLCED